MKPLLQIALDHTDLAEAVEIAAAVKDEVDIVEAGTILCVCAGINTIKILRRLCGEKKIIVCDLKVADAGDILARQAFSHGATWMTVVCAAPVATMLKAKEVADAHKGEIQIELFGNWDFNDAKNWVSNGITQAIYHRGRDAQAAGQSWSQADLDKMKALSDIGLALSITGGVNAEDLHLFKDINAKCFIAGRAIAKAADPIKACRDFKEAIERIWTS